MECKFSKRRQRNKELVTIGGGEVAKRVQFYHWDQLYIILEKHKK